MAKGIPDLGYNLCIQMQLDYMRVFYVRKNTAKDRYVSPKAASWNTRGFYLLLPSTSFLTSHLIKMEDIPTLRPRRDQARYQIYHSSVVSSSLLPSGIYSSYRRKESIDSDDTGPFSIRVWRFPDSIASRPETFRETLAASRRNDVKRICVNQTSSLGGIL